VGFRLDIQLEVPTYTPRAMTTAISFARREEERLGKENRHTVEAVDEPTIGKSSSSSTLACTTPTTQESVVTKIKVLELQFISPEFSDVLNIAH